MRCDQLDLFPGQARLLIRDVICQPVRRDNANVGRLPFISDSPITDKNDESTHPFVAAAILVDQSPHLGGVRNCLVEAILFLCSAIDKDPFAITKRDLAASAPEFRLDRKDPGWSDHHMIDVITVAFQVVGDAVSVGAKIIQDFRDTEFPALPTVQLDEFSEYATKKNHAGPGRDDREAQLQFRGWRLMTPEPVFIESPENPKESRHEIQRKESVLDQPLLLVPERLAG
jgi:hypothetical protein